MSQTITIIPVSTIVIAFAYIVAIVSFAAVCTHIDLVYSFIFIAILAIALYKEQHKFVIPRWILTTISIIIVVYFAFMLDMNNFVFQFLNILLMLLAVKLLEEKRIRDYMQIYAISLFLLAGLGLLGIGIIFLLIILLFVFILSTAFIFLTYYAQDQTLEMSGETIKKIVLKCLSIPIFAILSSILLFAVLPRSQYPLLDFLNRPEGAKSGFTDKVRLGEVSSIQEDESIIFRASVPMLPESDLYWRGITLDTFDGTTWRASENKYLPDNPALPKPIRGHEVLQTIYLEPYQNAHLFALDVPFSMNRKVGKLLPDYTFVSSAYTLAITRRIRYDVTSYISHVISEQHIDKNRYLQLPKHISPKIIELVHTLIGKRTGQSAVQEILKHFATGQYRYSLQALPITKTPLEDFLFRSRYGNCEYFASALAVMLRIAKIPARMVGGYRGGYHNNIGQYYLVPQKNAHVWIEAFLTDKGWIRLDPTPSVAEAFTTPLKGNIYLRMNILFDTINYYWYSLVINYNLQKQITLARSVISGLKRPSFFLEFLKKPFFLYLIGSSFVALMIIFFARKVFIRHHTIEERIILQFLAKLQKAGYTKLPSHGLEEFVATIDEDILKSKAFHFVKAFESIYYRDLKPTKEQFSKLKFMLKEMDP